MPKKTALKKMTLKSALKGGREEREVFESNLLSLSTQDLPKTSE